MKNSQKIYVFSINEKLFLRENNEKVGHLKSLLKGFELQYHDEIIKIEEKSIGDRIFLRIHDESFLIRDREITTWPEKNVKYHFKHVNGMSYLLDLNKKKISKILSLDNVNFIEISKDVPDFNLILFFSLLTFIEG